MTHPDLNRDPAPSPDLGLMLRHRATVNFLKDYAAGHAARMARLERYLPPAVPVTIDRRTTLPYPDNRV